MKKYFSLLLIFSFITLQAQDKTTETSQEFQDNLNLEYADKEKSPLTDEDFKTFKSLDFYPINQKFIVEAKFIRTKKEKVFKMKTSTSRLPEYKKYGELHFTIDGVDCKLNAYQNIDLIKKPGFDDYLFLPFSDLTSGKETYIGGRYVDLRIQKGTTWKIDFNKAYNPYCAYNHEYSCPIVPLENDLNIEVLAGVKKFHD
ncbi:DUF1684 domain-containing protein [Flavobacterium aquatile]|uniref:DUF1684 domain-containing protein n=1 Tax=Flavobacterium aquatile LMG 4008 = ATCC 11947 TaxID=1453498 RepID=A0A095SSQ9_9FLAO|nr:DUF1684 domain-containing protein [Flavobacterium aquatile]KGD67404.1 hypothetical protein LG45_14445 [Flavobacterium aquatile LMG 4008 = ATCC 11947]OXA67055.1 hypothetical protein B0A61_09340 [Flavobacterium aquatile LMG 4008 = ATCC 11947]